METKLNVKLLSYTNNPELIIATAGKLCYSPSNIEDLLQKQDEESINKFINKLTSMGHESPLEHCSFNFAVEGVSRSLTHQLVRHRIASYSQQSQRYVREDDFDYVIPQDIKNDVRLKRTFEHYMRRTQIVYDELVFGLIEDYIFHKKYFKYIQSVLDKTNTDSIEFYAWCNSKKDLYIREFIEDLKEKY